MFWLTPDGEQARYWDIGDKLIANNSRVGSVSVHEAVSARFGDTPTNTVTKPVYLLVREPISRFISAMRKEHQGHIEPGTGNHFGLQSELAVGPKVFLYRFPDHLKEFGEDTGIGTIPWTNQSSTWLYSPTDKELALIRERYAGDFALFASIDSPGKRMDACR